MTDEAQYALPMPEEHAMRRFESKTVLITGASRGMGASHARGFAHEGANVVIGDILEDEGHALARDIGERAIFARLDVTSEADWLATVARAEKAFGPISVLVNNAGVMIPGSIADGDSQKWRMVVDVNLIGQYLGIRAVVPSLRGAGGGAIVNVSSAAGMTAAAGFSAYVASKWAVRGLTKCAALELGRFGIRVNSVHPGVVRTPMTVDPATGDVLLPTDAFAIPRPADPEEVTSAVLFIASEDARFATGTELAIDGGYALGPIADLEIPPSTGDFAEARH